MYNVYIQDTAASCKRNFMCYLRPNTRLRFACGLSASIRLDEAH